jgi:hypothetical protein
MLRFAFIAGMACLLGANVQAQNLLQIVPSCGSVSLPPGTSIEFMDQNGNTCTSGAGGSSPGPHQFVALPSTQTLTLTTSPQALTVPTGATVATLTVQTGAAMYRDDGTTLTQTNGLTLQVGGPYTYSGPLGSLNFILPSGVTGTTVSVAYYK